MSKTGTPWYRDGQRFADRAAAYLAAYRALPADAPQRAEIRSFSDYAAVRLIFESNRIENAGVRDVQETRRLILDLFPPIPDEYKQYRQFLLPAGQSKHRLLHMMQSYSAEALKQVETHRAAVAEQLERAKLAAGITFGKHSRSYEEVLRHYSAWAVCLAVTHLFLADRMLSAASVHTPRTKKVHELLHPPGQPPIVEKTLLDEKLIQEIHEVLSAGLLRADAKVNPGEYRVDIRSVGEHITFPAPELVPSCMRQFVKRLGELLETENAPWEAAAEMSHRFVQIHPFPDFNGRMSRLILSAVLGAYGVPFALPLRGDSRGKARYLAALRRADTGKLDHFTTLIARTLVGCFEEIDVNLKLAGLPPLVD